MIGQHTFGCKLRHRNLNADYRIGLLRDTKGQYVRTAEIFIQKIVYRGALFPNSSSAGVDNILGLRRRVRGRRGRRRGGGGGGGGGGRINRMSCWLVRKCRVVIRIGQKETVRELIWDLRRLVTLCELKHVSKDLENEQLGCSMVRRGVESKARYLRTRDANHAAIRFLHERIRFIGRLAVIGSAC